MPILRALDCQIDSLSVCCYLICCLKKTNWFWTASEAVFLKKKLLSYLGPAFAVFLLVASVAVIRQELKSYSFQDVIQSLSAISTTQRWLAVLFTAAGYGAMTGYDRLAFVHLKYPLAYWRSASTNFICSAVGNTIGFPLFTASAIRYRRYGRWGVPPLVTTEATAFALGSFWLGLFVLGGAAFLIAPLPVPPQLHLPFTTARPLGGVLALAGVVYALGCLMVRKPLTIKGHGFRFPSFGVAIAQFTVSSLDWGMAAAVLYALIPLDDMGYFSFLNIYLLAMGAGVISSVPGGAGVFETVIILLLDGKVPGDAVLASLFAYRMIYYLLPFAIALIFFLFQESAANFQVHRSRSE